MRAARHSCDSSRSRTAKHESSSAVSQNRIQRPRSILDDEVGASRSKQMKTRLLLIACLVMALLEIASAQNRTPNHWLAAGSRPDQYVTTLDKNEKHGGSASARIECIAIEPSGFGTLMQAFNASDYLGKR